MLALTQLYPRPLAQVQVLQMHLPGYILARAGEEVEFSKTRVIFLKGLDECWTKEVKNLKIILARK